MRGIVFLFLSCLILLPSALLATDQIGGHDVEDIDKIGDHDIDDVDSIGGVPLSPIEADSTAPTVSITTASQEISSDSLSVGWVASDDEGVTECRWRIGGPPSDSLGTVDNTSPAATSGYSAGHNALYIGCKDAEGNWGHQSIDVVYTVGMDVADIEVSWSAYEDPADIQGFYVYYASSQMGFEQMPNRRLATVADPTATSVEIDDVECGLYIGVAAYNEANESQLAAETPQLICP
jgi:hypothetical protein